jgi:hypothetical protein
MIINNIVDLFMKFMSTSFEENCKDLIENWGYDMNYLSFYNWKVFLESFENIYSEKVELFHKAEKT